MAEAIPYGVATSLVNTLASLAFKEIASIYGVESEIEWLKKIVEGIKDVLADADKKQHTDQHIQRWIKELKQVLYKADDVLDEIHTQHLLRNKDGKVRDFFSSSNPIVFRCKIARKIRNIKQQFHAVYENKSMLNLHPSGIVEVKHEKSSNWRETSSHVIQEDMVGREGNKRDIIDLLLNSNNDRDQNVSLVAIVGIGGLGKTALAQLVYNDADVESFFNMRIWVCVSQDFDVKALVKLILKSLLRKKEDSKKEKDDQRLKNLNGQRHLDDQPLELRQDELRNNSNGQRDLDDQPLELLQYELRKNLNGQRYLLVLDDVWNEDSEKWLHLKKYLMRGDEGSKILVTTRNQAVANKMGVKTSYLLKGLTNDQSWTLLKRLAFDQDQIMTKKLESIGQEIADKCGGVPLAIRVMGNLLREKSRESDWEAILEGDFWKQCKEDDSIMPILKLSYDSLAIELKQCFAYCSLYPKDHQYEKDELIYLWMAQGFLEVEIGDHCPEDVGEEYVRMLLMKSFLHDIERDELGEIRCFKMHDLMHDLSQSIAGADYCMYAEGRKNVVMCPIHASFEKYNSNSSLNNTLDPSRLRTFLEIERRCERNPSDLIVFKRLRSLDLVPYHEMRYLPKSIGKMRHLRYLNLFDLEDLDCLPKSIGSLVNLQTLILDCVGFHRDKCSGGDIITKLINLRRLDIEKCIAFEDGMPVGLGRMTSLQRLLNFVVGNDDKKRKKAKLSELKELNLRGRLTIEQLDLVRDVEEESKDVNLIAKKKLISLTLDWGPDPKMKNIDAMQLLKNLQPHQNLKALRIQWYPGLCLSDWLLSCENLVDLRFFDIKNCHYLVALEGFVSLKTLHIKSMDKLEYIYYKGSSSSSTNFFPSLEELRIIDCESLRGWLREANIQNERDNDECHHSLPPFSRLSSLVIDGCSNLSCMPTFPNLTGDLKLIETNMKPLLDTLNVSSKAEPSTPHDVVASLSMLKFLHIEGIVLEALPDEWMQNLSSLKHLFIWSCSSLEKLFRQMQNLSAILEELTISNLDGDCNIKCQDLCCLHSLQKISFDLCGHLVDLPEWICDLQSLRFIDIFYCRNLESFPKGMCRLTNLQEITMASVPLLKERCERERGAEWPRIAHIPNIRIDKRQI